MARISTYAVDNNINPSDKVLGSDSQGLGTKNYTFQGIVNWFNATGGVAINEQNNYFFQSVAGNTGRQQGTVSFNSFGGVGTLFSAITQVKLAEQAVSGYTLEDYLPIIVGKNIMFAQLDNLNDFGIYKVISITRDLVETDFFNVVVQFIQGHGALVLDKYYGISLTSLGVVQAIPNLDQVLTAGNQSLLYAEVGGLRLYDRVASGSYDGIITTNNRVFSLVNQGSIADFTYDEFTLYNQTNNGYTKFQGSARQNNIFTLQDASGTLAFLSDIPSLTGYVPTSRTLTINGTSYDLTADRSWSVGTVTSVGLLMPPAFTVTNNPVTGIGNLTVTGAGVASQYIRGDGTLATFPTSTGGGSSINYYLNGSISQGTFGGVTYYQMSRTPILGAGTNFTRTNGAGNGYIASFITDAGDPNQLNIPGGNWNVEFYFNASSSGGSPSFYAELYKVDATNVFTLIASDSLNPEAITNGTTVDQYFTSIPVPQTTLLTTDRLAVRIFVNTGGRTITLHTENGNLSEVLTTFSSGLTALNGLTSQVQYFAVGTSGTNFNISSVTDTHTFNLPTASALNRGALSSADWTAFNSKFNLPSLTSGSVLFSNGTTIAQDNTNLFWDDTNNRLGVGTLSPQNRLDVNGSAIISGSLNLTTPAITGRETLLTGMVSDNSVDKFQIGNSTTVASRFGPTFIGYTGGAYTGLAFRGLGDSVNDLSSTTSYVAFLAANTNNSTDPNNGTLTAPVNRDLFTFGTTGATYLTIKAGGNVAIGATTANARLDVRAQGALTTDIALKVRNSVDTADLFNVNGAGQVNGVSFNATNAVMTTRGGKADLYGFTGPTLSYYNGVAIVPALTVIDTGSILIGTSGPAASAKLDVFSTTQGFLPPRMTTTQRNAIVTPATGLVVYDNTLLSLYQFNGTAWVAVGAGGGSTKSINSISTNTAAGSLASTDYFYFASGTINITLPTAVGNNNNYVIKNVGTGTITIDTTSSQTIDGSLTAPIKVQYLSLTLISDGANWNII